MIPSTLAKRIVSRFERAVARRACAHAAGQSDRAITFEYRQAKRELLNLLELLRTGENPDKSMEDRTYLSQLLERVREMGGTESSVSNKPKEPSPNP